MNEIRPGGHAESEAGTPADHVFRLDLDFIPGGVSPDLIDRPFRPRELLGERCIFRAKADSDSDSFRTPIPVQSGHRFRLIAATFLRGPESEAALDNFSRMGQDAFLERRIEWPERGYPCGRYEKY